MKSIFLTVGITAIIAMLSLIFLLNFTSVKPKELKLKTDKEWVLLKNKTDNKLSLMKHVAYNAGGYQIILCDTIVDYNSKLMTYNQGDTIKKVNFPELFTIQN